ncbi:hypothetical protein [Streptomyces sp. SM1]|uniref:hypothetical protein n=1 Tax=Streptomyces sp. SM1 TaxID=402229 RepID=UPI001CA4FAEC|nr:hypothetical protein [Streptomyces sp. SM1]
MVLRAVDELLDPVLVPVVAHLVPDARQRVGAVHPVGTAAGPSRVRLDDDGVARPRGELLDRADGVRAAGPGDPHAQFLGPPVHHVLVAEVERPAGGEARDAVVAPGPRGGQHIALEQREDPLDAVLGDDPVDGGAYGRRVVEVGVVLREALGLRCLPPGGQQHDGGHTQAGGGRHDTAELGGVAAGGGPVDHQDRTVHGLLLIHGARSTGHRTAPPGRGSRRGSSAGPSRRRGR